MRWSLAGRTPHLSSRSKQKPVRENNKTFRVCDFLLVSLDKITTLSCYQQIIWYVWVEISIGHRNSYIPGVASRLSVCVNAPDRLSQWLPFSALIIYCVCQLPITGSLITFSTLCPCISLSDFVACQVSVKLIQLLRYCYAFEVNTVVDIDATKYYNIVDICFTNWLRERHLESRVLRKSPSWISTLFIFMLRCTSWCKTNSPIIIKELVRSHAQKKIWTII